MDDEEEEHEATGGSLLEIQSIEENDVENIAAIVMSLFPHSLRKASVQCGSQKASTKLVLTTTTTPCTQPRLGPI